MRDLDRPGASPTADVNTLRRYVEQFKDIAIMRGQIVDFEIPAGDLFTSVRHSLQRAYVGAVVVGQSVNGGVVFALDPTSATTDVDITTHVRFGITDAPFGAPLRVRAWIF